jgi:ribosomal protein S18
MSLKDKIKKYINNNHGLIVSILLMVPKINRINIDYKHNKSLKRFITEILFSKRYSETSLSENHEAKADKC